MEIVDWFFTIETMTHSPGDPFSFKNPKLIPSTSSFHATSPRLASTELASVFRSFAQSLLF